MTTTSHDLPEPDRLAEELWEAAADLEDEGSLAAAAELYRQAVSAYELADDDQTARRLELHLGGLLTTIGQPTEAHEAFLRVSHWAQESGDRLLDAQVRVWQAELLVDQGVEEGSGRSTADRGHLDQAADLLRTALEVFDAHPDEDHAARLQAVLLSAEVAFLTEDAAQAVEHYRRALAQVLGDAADREESAAHAEEIVLDLVEAAVAAGQAQEATQVLKDARRRALREKDEEGVWIWTLHLGQHLISVGEIEAGQLWLLRLRDQLEIAGDQDYLPEVRAALAAVGA